MPFKKLVRIHFDKTVLAMEPPAITVELKRKLLKDKTKHPRFNLFFDNMAKELCNVQVMRSKQGKKPATTEQLRWLVEEMTKVFVTSIEVEANRMIESDLKKLARERAMQDQADIEATVSGNTQGVFEEMGVIFEKEPGQQEADQEKEQENRSGF